MCSSWRPANKRRARRNSDLYFLGAAVSAGSVTLRIWSAGYVLERLDDSAGPVDLNGVGLCFRAQTEVHRPEARGRVTDAGCLVVVLCAGIRHNLDPRADAIAIRFDTAQSDVEPVTGIGAAIHPQLRVLIQTGGDDVDAAIPIEVAEGTAAMTRGGGIGEACFRSE